MTVHIDTTTLLMLLTAFGNVVVLALLSLCLSVWLAARVGRRAALLFVGCVGLVGCVTAALKILFSSCGLQVWHVHSVSGHTSFSTVAYGGLGIVLAAGRGDTARRWIAALTLFWIAAIGVSRVLIKAHTPPEVLAGAMLGALGVIVFALAYRGRQAPELLWSLPAAAIVIFAAYTPQIHLNLEPYWQQLGRLPLLHEVCRSLR